MKKTFDDFDIPESGHDCENYPINNDIALDGAELEEF